MSEINDAVQKKLYEKKMEIVVNALLKLQGDMYDSLHESERYRNDYEQLSERYNHLSSLSVDDAHKVITDKLTLRTGSYKSF